MKKQGFGSLLTVAITLFAVYALADTCIFTAGYDFAVSTASTRNADVVLYDVGRHRTVPDGDVL